MSSTVNMKVTGTPTSTVIPDISKAMLCFENNDFATMQFKVPVTKSVRIVWGTPLQTDNLSMKFHQNSATTLESGISFYTNNDTSVGQHALSVNPFQEVCIPNFCYLGTTYPSNCFAQQEYIFTGTLPTTANTTAVIATLPSGMDGSKCVRIASVFTKSNGTIVPHLSATTNEYYIAYLSYISGTSYQVSVYTGTSASVCLGRPVKIVLTFQK